MLETRGRAKQLDAFPETFGAALALLQSECTWAQAETCWVRIGLYQQTMVAQPDGEWVDDDLLLAEWDFARGFDGSRLTRLRGVHCHLSKAESLACSVAFVEELTRDQRSALQLFALSDEQFCKFRGLALPKPELYVCTEVADLLKREVCPAAQLYRM